jgi:hypothetical protein
MVESEKQAVQSKHWKPVKEARVLKRVINSQLQIGKKQYTPSIQRNGHSFLTHAFQADNLKN